MAVPEEYQDGVHAVSQHSVTVLMKSFSRSVDSWSLSPSPPQCVLIAGTEKAWTELGWGWPIKEAGLEMYDRGGEFLVSGVA